MACKHVYIALRIPDQSVVPIKKGRKVLLGALKIVQAGHCSDRWSYISQFSLPCAAPGWPDLLPMQQRCHGWRELQESSLAAVLGVCKGHASFILTFSHLVTGCPALCKCLHVSTRHLSTKAFIFAGKDTSDFLHAELLRTTDPPVCLYLALVACIPMQAMGPSLRPGGSLEW